MPKLRAPSFFCAYCATARACALLVGMSRKTYSPICVSPSARERDTMGTPSCCARMARSEEHTSELQSRSDLVCRLLLEIKKPESWGHCYIPHGPPDAGGLWILM